MEYCSRFWSKELWSGGGEGKKLVWEIFRAELIGVEKMT